MTKEKFLKASFSPSESSRSNNDDMIEYKNIHSAKYALRKIHMRGEGRCNWTCHFKVLMLGLQIIEGDVLLSA